MIVKQNVNHGVAYDQWATWCDENIRDGWKIVAVTATHFAPQPDGSIKATHFLVVAERIEP